MPGFAKFLVAMILLVAGVFLYLATIDFNARRPWAYQVFRSELAVYGLPLDDRDPGPLRVEIALYQDIDDQTMVDMFAKGEKPVKTQEDEVKRLRDEIVKELDGMKNDEDKRRDTLRDYILPLARTLEEREYWQKRVLDKDENLDTLQKDFIREYFDRALIKDDEDAQPELADWLYRKTKEDGKSVVKPEKHIKLTRREKIAHLLYNLSPSAQAHTRVMNVIGLKSYIHEAESQAARLREMSLRTRMAMVEERSLFEMEYQRLQQRIMTLMEKLEAKKLYFTDKVSARDRTKELVKIREDDKKVLLEQLGVAETTLKAALDEQVMVEAQVFETQKRLGDLQAKTETLQRYISRLEGVPGRN